MIKTISMIAVLLFSASLSAAPSRMYWSDRGTVIDGVALNAAEASRTTASVLTIGYSTLTLGIALDQDAGNSVTSVDVTCTGSVRNAADGTYYKIPVIASSDVSGIVTYEQYTGRYDTSSGDDQWSITLSVIGHWNVKCIFTGNGTPDANDALTVVAAVSVP